jgi:hypothetical protein
MAAVRVFPRRKGGECLWPDRQAGRPPLHLDLGSIEPFVALTQKDAARRLGISLTALKKVCRRLGLHSWAEARSSLCKGAHFHGPRRWTLRDQEGPSAFCRSPSSSSADACPPPSPAIQAECKAVLLQPASTLGYNVCVSTSTIASAGHYSEQDLAKMHLTPTDSLSAFLDSLDFEDVGPHIPSGAVTDLMSIPPRIQAHDCAPVEDGPWRQVGDRQQWHDVEATIEDYADDLSYLVGLSPHRPQLHGRARPRKDAFDAHRFAECVDRR